MIIKSKRFRTDSTTDLASYILENEKNEVVRLLSGNTADIQLMKEDARKYGSKYMSRHVTISPAEETTEQQIFEIVDRYLKDFGLEGQPYLLAEHTKSRADDGAYPKHYHLALPEVNPITGKILDSSFTMKKDEKHSREAELLLGHKIVPGKHSKSVYFAFLEEGKKEYADKIKYLLDSDLPKSAFSEKQFQEAKRKGVSLSEVKEIVQDCYSRSDNYPSLLAAMKEKGLHVQQGTKTLIIKNDEGTELGSLQRLLKMKKNEFEKYIEGEQINEQANIEPEAKTPAPEPKNSTEQQSNESNLRTEQDSSRQQQNDYINVDRATKNRVRREPNQSIITRDRPVDETNRRLGNTKQNANEDVQSNRREHKSVSQEVIEQIQLNQLKQAILDREQAKKQKNFNENVALYQLSEALVERYKKPEPKPKKPLENIEAKVIDFIKERKPKDIALHKINILIKDYENRKKIVEQLPSNELDYIRENNGKLKQFEKARSELIIKREEIEKKYKEHEELEPKGFLSKMLGKHKKWKKEEESLFKQRYKIRVSHNDSFIDVQNEKEKLSTEYKRKLVIKDKSLEQLNKVLEPALKMRDYIEAGNQTAINNLAATDPDFPSTIISGTWSTLHEISKEEEARKPKPIREYQPTYSTNYDDDDEDEYEPSGPSM
ncbi:relaxase/mobilization nuclease domain-containing protein [Rhodospirillum sp. A1_3_36]|uniref:relaxase/mobilization nuclease domain-containing protein n=1 Tax=Rhodospirillum sp. A1_3_36 TaxID=3391666 RepID=UPI0039A4E115